MLKKNKELELEAMNQISAEKGGPQPGNKIDELELERLEMERAIAISMAVKDKMDEEEEKMIQEAIRQSEIEEQHRIEAEKAKHEKEVPKEVPKEHHEEKKKSELSSLSSLPPLMTAAKQQPIGKGCLIQPK
jgi:hypothetical protein